MKISAGKIIYVILLVVMIFLTVRFFTYSSGAFEEAKDKIVVLEGTEILEENEGKLVLVTGKMTPKNTLSFNEYGVEVQSPILERKVEMYQYVQEIDNQEKEVVKRMWSEDIPEDEVYDEIDKETYFNPDMKIESETLYGEAYLGKFLIDKELIKKLRTNTTFTDLKEIVDFKVIDGNTLINTKDDRTRIGDLKIKFDYLDLEKAGEYTIIGKQSGEKIIEYKLDTGLPILKIFEGIKTKDEVLESISKEKTRAAYFSLGFLILLLLIGVSRLKVASNKQKVEDDFVSLEERMTKKEEQKEEPNEEEI